MKLGQFLKQYWHLCQLVRIYLEKKVHLIKHLFKQKENNKAYVESILTLRGFFEAASKRTSQWLSNCSVDSVLF